MTDRFNALTVVLEKDIRDDDAEAIIQAIKMVKGVLSVDGNVADIEAHLATERVRRELLQKLIGVLCPKDGG